jgi:hypothetical protein
MVKGVTVLREPKIRMMNVLLRVWLFMNTIEIKTQTLCSGTVFAIPEYFFTLLTVALKHAFRRQF